MSAGIEQMIAEGRTGRQLEMVREHWASVRRLWLGDLLLDHELIAEDVEIGTRLEAALAPSIMVMEAA